MINCAVIGLGSMGRHHARNYFEIENANLVAVADIDESRKKIVKDYGCKFYKDYKEMLKKEKIDVVSIAVPTYLHKEVAIDCIEKGINVLLEKPIADTVKNAKIIIDKVKEKKVKFMVGHVERFNPAVKKLKEIVKNKELGEITTIMARRVGLFPPQIKDTNVIIDLAIHDIDIFNYLLEDLPIQHHCLTGKALVTKREDYADLLLKYKNGTNAMLQVNWVTPIKIRLLNITGTKGYAELDYITQSLTLYKSNYSKEFGDFDEVVRFSKPDKIELGIENKEPLKEELIHFLECVKENKEPDMKGEEALEALRIAIDLLNSIKVNS